MPDDDLHGRRPTSHERMAGRPWDASYTQGPAPWDIGGPQPAIVRLVAQESIEGPVLDAGCGLGENSLHLASHGLSVVGVDVAETALGIARSNAEQRGLDAEFLLGDALGLRRLERTFASVLDSGLFHSLDADERRTYVASLAAVTEPGARLYVLCFSDEGADVGPHPVSRDDLTSAFTAGSGWRLVTVVPERVATRFHGPDGAPGWLVTAERSSP